MMVVVQATNEFNEYSVFLRGMGVAMSIMDPEDKEFAIYVVGSKLGKLPDFAMEFCNLSEKGMKLRGKKIRMYRTTDLWVSEFLHLMDYFAFFSNAGQPLSTLAKKAKEKNIELGIFQY